MATYEPEVLLDDGEDPEDAALVAEAEPSMTLGPDDHGSLVSSEDFARAEFIEPWTYEREAGRLIVMAPEGYRHLRGTNPWRDLLVLYKIHHAHIVEDVVQNAWIRVDDGTDRIGDLGVYLGSDGPTRLIPDRVPEMMFEIVSPGMESRDRDYVTKKAEYFAFGIREYVIVDAWRKRTKRVTASTWTPVGYLDRVLSPRDTYTSPLVPGLAIPLAQVLPR